MFSETSVISAANVQLFRGRSKRKSGLRMLRRKVRLLTRLLTSAALFEALAEPEGVEARQVQQGQESCNKQTSHDGDRHRPPERRARQRDNRPARGERREHHRSRTANG